MLRLLRLFVVVSVGLASPTGRASTGPEVETNNGRIMGFAEIVEGVTVHTFLGIPFAEPPINDLRFKPPVPISDWNSTLTANQLPKSCHQVLYDYFPEIPAESMWNPKTELSEDCLYLNIWVPASHITGETRNKLTTMLWVFGGGFVAGTSALHIYEGKFLAATTGVIVVTINYRVGPFGFMYLANQEIPGNMGLMDQNLALKWVYDNIHHFGGDSDKISLFGESAGAASIHYHLLSEESRRYFTNAILQSGSALAPWAYRSPAESYSISRKFAELVGCEQEDVSDLVACLVEVDADTLTKEQWNLVLSWTFSTFPFVPTRDGNLIKSSPSESVRKGDYARKPLLLGVTKNEYSYWIIYGLAGQMDLQTGHLTDYNETSLKDKIPLAVDPQMPPIIRSSILNQYDTHFPEGLSLMEMLDNIGGDYNFKCPTLAIANATVNMHNSLDSPKVYVYTYNHRASNNPWPMWSGVLHGDEIELIFGMPLKEGSTFTEEEKDFSRKVMTFWSNFAKTGNPNVGVDLSSVNRNVEQVTEEETMVEQILTLNKRSNSDDLSKSDQAGTNIEKNVITNFNNQHITPTTIKETEKSHVVANILEISKEINELVQDQENNELKQRHVENQGQINRETSDQNPLTSEIEVLSSANNHEGLSTTQTTGRQDSTSQVFIQTTAKTGTIREEITTLANERQQNSLWPPYRQGEEKYVILQSGASLSINTGLCHNECRFWNVFYKELQDLIKESKNCERRLH